ncbi:hypothetical protein D9M71_371120 [compost metagenome]
MLHDVAVVGDHVERHPVVGHPGALRATKFTAIAAHFADHGDLHVARHRAIEDAQAIAACTHVKVGFVQPVDHHLVADEAVDIERVEPQLAALVPGLVGKGQVDVIVTVAPRQCRTAGQAQVDAVFQGLVAAVQGTVVVHHRRVALVDVVGGEIEHVIVEPVGAHGFAPVTADLDAAVLAGLEPGLAIVDPECFPLGAGERGPGVLRGGVDGVVAGQLHRPAVVVVLTGEEERVGITVAFGRVMAVVFMGAEGMQTEAAVGCRVDRQGVVVTHQYRLAVAGHQQLGRKSAVEGPQRVVVLDRHVRVKADTDAFGRPLGSRYTGGVVIKPAGTELAFGIAVHLPVVAQALVDPRAGLRGLDRRLRVELVPALMRPAFSWWPALGRRADWVAIEEGFDLRLPGIAVEDVGVLRRERQ